MNDAEHKPRVSPTLAEQSQLRAEGSINAIADQPARIAELERRVGELEGELAKYHGPAINPPCPTCPSSTPDQVIFAPVYGGNHHFFCKSCEQSFAGSFTYGPSELATLRAEVERLTKERDEARTESSGVKMMRTLDGNCHTDTINELRTQLAASEEDRKRLDWIDAKTRRPWIHNATSGYTESFGPKSPYWGIAVQDRATVYGDTLRAAIDAARAQEEKK